LRCLHGAGRWQGCRSCLMLAVRPRAAVVTVEDCRGMKASRRCRRASASTMLFMRLLHAGHDHDRACLAERGA
jgi:hypothetical protein